MGRRFLLLVLAAAIALTGQIARPFAQDLTRAAFDDLKHGGFVVVFRHGKTNASPAFPEDKSPLDLANCADQVMLSQEGQDQARAAGLAFGSAGIPVGIKDVIDTVDMPTEHGSQIYRGNRPYADAACVALIRAAVISDSGVSAPKAAVNVAR